MKKAGKERQEDPEFRIYKMFMEIAQATNKYSDRRLRQSNHLKTATYVALQGLITNEGVMSHTKLAEWTNTRKHNITGLVDRMRKEGLVTTEQSLKDRRLVPITITKKGRKLFDAASLTYQDIMKKIMHNVVGDKVLQLEIVLKVMKSNIEQQSQ